MGRLGLRLRLLLLVVVAGLAPSSVGAGPLPSSTLLPPLPPPPLPSASSAPSSAQCLESWCFGLFWEARSFLAAGGACERGGGRLMRARSTVAAEAIELLRGGRAGGVWLGLRLPEGRCVEAGRALRGFQWVAGDERTDFQAWAADGPDEGACGPRCVVVGADLRWEERDCGAAADGFLCEYSYPGGTCAPLAPLPPADGPVHYTTPFGARDGDLSAFPPATVAEVPGLAATLVCQERANGSWGWAAVEPGAWACQLEGGGCEGRCGEDAQGRPFCTCPDGAPIVAEDGRSCLSPCDQLRCEHQCALDGERAVCLCQEGYVLDPDDGRSCRDIDDCQAQPGPCQQKCVNTAGGFLCHCFQGYTLVEGQCTENDRLCIHASCQQDCFEANGTFHCTCYEGFAPDRKDPRHCVPFCNSSKCPARCDPHTGEQCYCPEGYILQEPDDGPKVCTDINECEEGYCDGECRNLFGGYECVSQRPDIVDASQRPDYEGSGDVTLYSTETPVLTSGPPRRGRSPGNLVAIIVSTVLSFVALVAVVYCFLKKLGASRTKMDYKCQQLETEVVMEQVRLESPSHKQKM